MPRIPDPPLTPYTRFYSSGILNKLRKNHPNVSGWELNKIVGQIWKNMSYEERQPYRDQYQMEKQQYEYAVKQFNVQFDQWQQRQKKNPETSTGVLANSIPSYEKAKSTRGADRIHQHVSQASSIPYEKAKSTGIASRVHQHVSQTISTHIHQSYNAPSPHVQQQQRQSAVEAMSTKEKSPKKSLSPYMRFSSSQYKKFKEENPDLDF